jgi:hypothetical protein
MAALAILVAVTLTQPPPPTGLAAVSVPETRRLINILTSHTIDIPSAWQWSMWRRRHRATAEASHRKRREIIESEQLTR